MRAMAKPYYQLEQVVRPDALISVAAPAMTAQAIPTLMTMSWILETPKTCSIAQKTMATKAQTPTMALKFDATEHRNWTGQH